MRACDLEIHQSATVIMLHVSKQDEQRLFYLGIYIGATIQLVRKAPFEGPYLFICSENEFMLRKRTASFIDVEVIV